MPARPVVSPARWASAHRIRPSPAARIPSTTRPGAASPTTAAADVASLVSEGKTMAAPFSSWDWRLGWRSAAVVGGRWPGKVAHFAPIAPTERNALRQIAPFAPTAVNALRRFAPIAPAAVNALRRFAPIAPAEVNALRRFAPFAPTEVNALRQVAPIAPIELNALTQIAAIAPTEVNALTQIAAIAPIQRNLPRQLVAHAATEFDARCLGDARASFQGLFFRCGLGTVA